MIISTTSKNRSFFMLGYADVMAWLGSFKPAA